MEEHAARPYALQGGQSMSGKIYRPCRAPGASPGAAEWCREYCNYYGSGKCYYDWKTGKMMVLQEGKS